MWLENTFFPFLWKCVDNNDVGGGDDNFSYFIQPFSNLKEIYTNGYPGNQSQILAQNKFLLWSLLL